MRQTIIIAGTALVSAAIAVWGTTVIIAQSPKTSAAIKAAPSIEVIEMMKRAKNLPEEKFDAH